MIKSDEWMYSVMEEGRLNLTALRTSDPKIQKVIPTLRNVKENEGCYDPTAVSLGPYHHGDPKLQKVENLKSIVAFNFISESNSHPNEFYDSILNLISVARNCYLEGSTNAYDDEAFAHMMLLDGCFLLYFIETFVNVKSHLVFGSLGSGTFTMVVVDNFKLENQLPFLILQALMKIKYPKGEGEILLNNFIDNLLIGGETLPEKGEGCQPLHFLELVRKKFLRRHKVKEGRNNDETGDSIPLKELWCSKQKMKEIVDHPKLFGQYKLIGKRTFRSATELKANGIHFKNGNSFCLTDIRYENSLFGFGHLTLPQIYIDDYLKVIFLNMIAYELAPMTTADLEVCTYIYFMSVIINEAEDVTELRSHGIIHSGLNSDKHVAKTFHSMSTNIIPKDTVADVFDKIEEHYGSKVKTWIAQLVHNNFSTPWTVVAFLGAVLVTILTATQTYFQMYPPPGSPK